jgi:hypothetical protein
MFRFLQHMRENSELSVDEAGDDTWKKMGCYGTRLVFRGYEGMRRLSGVISLGVVTVSRSAI